MRKQSKGEKTKRSIIDQINSLFNEKEMFLTWDEIATELNLSRSRITNYFPKKDLLVLAIYYQFEEKLKDKLQENQGSVTSISLQSLNDYYSNILDLLYEYRFSISYVLVNPTNDNELRDHIDKTYKNNKIRLRERVESLVKEDIVQKELLLIQNFEPFEFQHTNLLTTWIITYRLYDQTKGFKTMKPVYQKGILNCYLPYLTQKGKMEFQELILE